MSDLPLYIRLRGAVFHEAGYCLDAPHLTKDSAAFFVINDTKGKAVKTERVPGCDGDSEGVTLIQLTPYPEPEKARLLLALMCGKLADALGSDKNAQNELGAYWYSLLREGLALKYQDEQTQAALLSHFLGAGRWFEGMNKGHIESPDLATLVAEALA